MRTDAEGQVGAAREMRQNVAHIRKYERDFLFQ
jgi:hypothetical protein